jgi:nicotinic acid mononucleotide adenylyltransferase
MHLINQQLTNIGMAKLTMLGFLRIKLEEFDGNVIPTTKSKAQFERNVKCGFQAEHVSARIKMMERQIDYIGREVFKYKKNSSVTTIEEYDISTSKLNPLEDYSFTYSDEHFLEFQKWYIPFQIERLTETLLTKRIHFGSTDPFENLEYQWILESTQELITIYKDALSKINIPAR